MLPTTESKPTTYSFSKKFRISIYFSILFFFILALLTVYVGIIDRTEPNPNAPLVIALALVFLTCAYYNFDILPKVHSTITLNGDGIVQEFRNGQTIFIKWRDITGVRGRQFLGRIEVLSKERGKTIHIEAQIEGFTEIVNSLRQKFKMDS